jgi:hypothetical protein
VLIGGLNPLVEDYWKSSNITVWMAFILKEKLKGLKNHIRVWNRENYGQLDSKIAKFVADINDLDIRSEVAGLADGDVVLRKNLFAQMWHIKISKESVLAQRLRSKWLKEGDENSRYFHACINSRGKKNFIRALRVDDEWMESPSLIRNETVAYFTNLFASDLWARPKLDGILFPTLDVDENQKLVHPFRLDEIEKVVMESDGNKSPGSDGFNFAFIKAMWNLIKGEIRILFDQFHGIGDSSQKFYVLFCSTNSQI